MDSSKNVTERMNSKEFKLKNQETVDSSSNNQGFGTVGTSNRLRRISTNSRKSIQIDRQQDEREEDNEQDGSKDQLIDLPNSSLSLPLRLSKLASTLHEIHRVSQMSSCSIGSPQTTFTYFTASLHSHGSQNRRPNRNTESLIKLSKAIEFNSKQNGEEYGLFGNIEQHAGGGSGIFKYQADRQRFIKRGKRWFKKKRVGILGGGGTGEVVGTESETVDGVGLPLPHGATLVQPWDSDWV
ncbi:expressed protein [Phakopsora pachyrhizi]|uniref:Expressed protein n=1 Tax=Phakopsora pachyrhizi TaxID=170000 RepID=A0AAV0BQ91_PHAPC|nr:expressed protein [Phakopsora pachyrhizi]